MESQGGGGINYKVNVIFSHPGERRINSPTPALPLAGLGRTCSLLCSSSFTHMDLLLGFHGAPEHDQDQNKTRTRFFFW
ncbi:hypothetical protein EYF80_041249 [Liparis tanakae]|uniref:Uncharacterized protein n=1 Tax=Liparis tanakae TaxID=230148 RepID=A0A4Z2G6M4_9TELE|nr:hypothetical protein EYF80_041249 [Liparis tanakae]